MSRTENPLRNQRTNDLELSIIIPIRNEEEYISRCIESLVFQGVPHNRYEIILVDGMSNDKTTEIMSHYQTKFPHLIRIFKNPCKTTPTGKNIGIRNARSHWILIFGGHCKAHPKLLSSLIKESDIISNDVGVVGAMHYPAPDESFQGILIHEVQSSLLGGTGTSYRNNSRQKDIESVAYGLYRRDIFYNVGLHDENLENGEDLDLNLRIKKAGFKLIISNEAIVYYYRKYTSYTALITKMLKYGKWKAIFYKSHPQSFKVIHLFPSLIIVMLLFLPITSFNNLILFYLNLILIFIYFSLLFINSVHICLKKKSTRYLPSFFIYFLEHSSYGLGFIFGLFNRTKNLNQTKSN